MVNRVHLGNILVAAAGTQLVVDPAGVTIMESSNEIVRKTIGDGAVNTLQVFRALKAGAQAYVMKNLVHKELLQAIRTVYAGRKTMSPEVAAQIAACAGDEALTSREIDVLRLIAAGCANKEIGARLSITEETVKSRVKSILDKLGANDRTHAVTTALKRGIIEL